MRVALIEIGSRATRLLVADFENDGQVRIIKKARTQIALGLAVDSGPQAAAKAIAEVLKQCRVFEQEAQLLKARRVARFGTEALRKIQNEKLLDISSLKAIVLTADAEAQFAFWGAVKDPNIGAKSGQAYIVVDLGSGSLEVVSGLLKGEVPAVVGKKSINIGANYLVRLFREMDHDATAFTTEIKKLLDDAGLPQPKNLSKVILAGGVATKTAWLKVRDSQSDPYDDKRMNGPSLTIKDLDALLIALISMARADPIRAALFVEPRRVDLDELTQVIAGNILFMCLLKKWEMGEFRVTTQGPRFGVAYKLAQDAS